MEMDGKAVRKAKCGLCPHGCLIEPEGRGLCRVRVNVGGKLRSVTYGRPCAINVDPIEKKPLLHFLPGTDILSIATVGCNLRCLNCQNWEISQGLPEEIPAHELAPADLPALAARHHTPSVAYTYTEPLVFYEYTRDCCRAARQEGLRNVLVTAAYINPAPLRALAPLVDAANVDIKAMSETFYGDVCGATLAPVLKAICVMRDAGVHLEITNLVIPTLNDSERMLRDLAVWVRGELGAETPLHFSRFFPKHRMTHLPPTPPATLLLARDLARAEGLKHVYVGNVEVEGGEDTCCAGCGRTLIRRRQYSVLSNEIADGKCPKCGYAAKGVWN
ncbi:MAG: AmmeMemoRadiSam system radical SAM enzyme [Kiritimatiellae bacterium]|nr:AmmeMemoRadiSam system radical SAM enzyme [Kiritimatiellia bacterium]